MDPINPDKMQTLQQLGTALKNPNYNPQQCQQQVMNIMKANPKVMEDFLKQNPQLRENQLFAQQGNNRGQNWPGVLSRLVPCRIVL